jgi:hypothetical protein
MRGAFLFHQIRLAPGVTAPGALFWTITGLEPNLEGNKMKSASTWPLRTVSRAADVDSRTLRQWFGTGILHLRGDDKKSTGTGRHVGLSRSRAYEAAIVRQLTQRGVATSRAANGAFAFTLSGEGGRAAGQLYPLGRTVLVLRQHDAVVANVDPDARVRDLSHSGICIAVDCNKIVADVDAVLNSKH